MDAVFNNIVYLKLRIMERLVETTETACSENLRCPLAEDGMDI